MNSAYYQNCIARIEREIAELQKKIAWDTKKQFDKEKHISDVQRTINSKTSASTLLSKQRQIESDRRSIYDIQKRMVDNQNKLAKKNQELNKKRQELLKAEESERKKQQKEQLDFQQKLQRDLDEQTSLLNQLLRLDYSTSTGIGYENNESIDLKKEFDFFISHASEDKVEFVQPLAEAMEKAGFKVWYDAFSLKWGDSLRRKIDEGLSISKFGIVVLSTNFFKKEWPNYELDGLVEKEMNGKKAILPIWHKVSKDEVRSYSPSLANKVALNTSIHTIEDIIDQLKDIINQN